MFELVGGVEVELLVKKDDPFFVNILILLLLESENDEDECKPNS